MEDDNNIVEDNNYLNYEEGFSDKFENQKKLFSSDEVENIKKEMERNFQKGVQKLIFEKKLLQQSIKELALIGERSERLLEIAEENPSLANMILTEFFEETLEEYKERIGYIDDLRDPKVLKKRIEDEATLKAWEQVFRIEKQKFISKLQMSSDEIEMFEDALFGILNDNNFDLDNLDELFEKAYRVGTFDFEINKGIENQEMLGKLMTTSGGKGNGGTRDKKKNKVRADVEEFFRKYKL